MKTVDTITLAVIANNLEWATEEMCTYLTRAAFSSNIKVRKDCSCALYDCKGDLLAQGTFIPVHLGIMSQSLIEVLKRWPREEIHEGDVFLLNNPYMKASHLNDVTVFKPIFVDGDIVGFAGVLAHHVDVGGSPISFISKTLYEEGMIFSGIKIVEAGKLQQNVFDLILSNVRTPYELKGDLMAQIASLQRGELRIQSLAAKYGKQQLLDYFEDIIDYSEAGMRGSIRALPNGTAEFEDYLDLHAYTGGPVKFKAKVTVEDEDIYVDLDGSGPPAPCGHNSPESLTRSGVYFAVKAVIGSDVLTNAGAYKAIHVIMPDYPSIVNAQPPCAICGGTCVTEERICDVVIGALAQLFPNKACACDGHWTSFSFIGFDPKRERYYSYLEAYAVGKGAKHDQDGANAHVSHMSNTANAPVEIIELEHPLIVEKYGLVQDSCGAGEYRGGLSMRKEITTIPAASMSVTTGRPKTPPYGLAGGRPGACEYIAVRYADGREERCEKGLEVPANTTMIMQTSGGGGWGDPRRRNVKDIEWDLLNGFISPKAAEQLYDCQVAADGKHVSR